MLIAILVIVDIILVIAVTVLSVTAYCFYSRLTSVEDQQFKLNEIANLMQSAHDTTCDALEHTQEFLKELSSEFEESKYFTQKLSGKLNSLENDMQEELSTKQ